MKKRLFSVYLKELFISPKLYAATAIVAVVFCISYKMNPMDSLISLSGGMLADFMRIINYVPAALPFIMSYCDDCTNQYIRPLVVRSGVPKYTRSKFMVGFISAFITLFAGMMFAFFIIRLNGVPLLDPYNSESGLSYGYFIELGIPVMTLITKAFIYALYGAVYASVGLVVSAVIPNKFMAMVTPLAVCFITDEMGWAFLPNWLDTYHLGISERAFQGTGLGNMLLNLGWTVFVALFLSVVLYLIFDLLVHKRVNCEINN